MPPYVPIQEEQSSSWRNKLILLMALCLLAGTAAVLMVRMNSGPAIPTQVVETKDAPVTPAPPAVSELKNDDTTVVKVPDIPAVSKPKPVVIPKKKAAVPANGEVQLLSDPPGANVTVDNGQSCTTPCSFTLAAGRHTLAARLPGFGIARKIFNVPQDLNIILPLEKSVGTLLVSSDPSGATVNVDDQPAGRTPLTLRLTPGVHRVSVSDGTRRHEESVQITSDQFNTRLFRF